MESASLFFRVDRKDIVYLRYTVESYDGIALVKTHDPKKGLIEIRIAPGCEGTVRQLMKALQREENLSIHEIRH